MLPPESSTPRRAASIAGSDCPSAERVLRTAVEHVGLGAKVAEALAQRIDPYRVADTIFRGVVDEEQRNSS